jgi:hypothetical protein
LISGYPNQLDTDVDDDAVELLTKPFSTNSLTSLIRRLLDTLDGESDDRPTHL